MRPSLIPSLLLVLLTALAFWPARNATFLLYDDTRHVTENPYILPPTPARLAYFWRYPLNRTPVPGVASTTGKLTPPYEEIYSPLAFTMWGLLVYPARIAPLRNSNDPLTQSAPQEAFSLDPAIYHSFNLGLHVLNVLLVFALLRHFVKREWAAVLGATLFAIHPVQVEPVAWVTGMNNLLSGFFALSALLLYLKNKDDSETPRFGKAAYWASVFCFLLSVLSKPSSATLPAVVLILCFGLGEKKWRTRLLEMIPWAGVALFSLVMNQLTQQDKDYGFKPIIWQKPFLVGDSLTFYASKLLFPWNLAPDYGRRPDWVMQQPLTYMVWLIPVSVSLLAWGWWRRSVKRGQESYLPRIVLASLALFVVVLLPSSGLISYYFHLISIVSDRYMYMALIGAALLVAIVAERCWELNNSSLRHFLAVLSFGLVAVLTVLSFRQTKFWQNDLPLWEHNIEVNPASTVAYYPYAMALSSKGEYRKAIPVLEQGLRVTPQSWLLEIGLGTAYFQVNEYAKAETHLRRCLELFPTSVNAHLLLGVISSQQGKLAEAIDQFSQGLQLQPRNPALLGYMGLNLAKVGKNAESVEYIKQALQNGFEPSRGRLYLGNSLAKEGKVKEAMGEWYAAVEANPNNYEALFNLGTAVAKLGNTKLAIQLFSNVIQVKPDYVRAYLQLGLQWQKQGQKEKAKAAFQNALKVEPQNKLALNSLKMLK